MLNLLRYSLARSSSFSLSSSENTHPLKSPMSRFRFVACSGACHDICTLYCARAVLVWVGTENQNVQNYGSRSTPTSPLRLNKSIWIISVSLSRALSLVSLKATFGIADSLSPFPYHNSTLSIPINWRSIGANACPSVSCHICCRLGATALVTLAYRLNAQFLSNMDRLGLIKCHALAVP